MKFLGSSSSSSSSGEAGGESICHSCQGEKEHSGNFFLDPEDEGQQRREPVEEEGVVEKEHVGEVEEVVTTR